MNYTCQVPGTRAGWHYCCRLQIQRAHLYVAYWIENELIVDIFDVLSIAAAVCGAADLGAVLACALWTMLAAGTSGVCPRFSQRPHTTDKFIMHHISVKQVNKQPDVWTETK